MNSCNKRAGRAVWRAVWLVTTAPGTTPSRTRGCQSCARRPGRALLSNRGYAKGLLTQASVLTATGASTTSPIHRGYWVIRKLTCTEPPPPPPNVPSFPEAKDSATLKQRLVQHRVEPTCAVCHNELDPMGMGLENFDGPATLVDLLQQLASSDLFRKHAGLAAAP